VLPINHDPCHHEIYYLSSDYVVLVFSELNYLFERFCKEKKTKGQSSLCMGAMVQELWNTEGECGQPTGGSEEFSVLSF